MWLKHNMMLTHAIEFLPPCSSSAILETTEKLILEGFPVLGTWTGCPIYAVALTLPPPYAGSLSCTNRCAVLDTVPCFQLFIVSHSELQFNAWKVPHKLNLKRCLLSKGEKLRKAKASLQHLMVYFLWWFMFREEEASGFYFLLWNSQHLSGILQGRIVGPAAKKIKESREPFSLPACGASSPSPPPISRNSSGGWEWQFHGMDGL